ncbi:ABC transporter permease [Actinotignum sanguinis]|uniref:ABC transporter permease n=1 Tax=Actinotignum sanguinis TaxID=1445614 RepID=UPI000F7EDA65|nr:ABC transporter permease [Actinotignum sanguinis]MDY5148913.1 ABC transporter permease [Actinotignum sanguinis]RTE49991.1 ABC transporter permease [Actinotignum sanguinis]
MTRIFGAVLEAWEEIRVDRGRVILSLVGVAAAVWAMATVLALGQLISAAGEHQLAQWDGKPGTVNIGVYRTGGEDPSDPYAKPYADPYANPYANPAAAPTGAQLGTLAGAQASEDVFGTTVAEYMESAGANYWTRSRISYVSLAFPPVVAGAGGADMQDLDGWESESMAGAEASGTPGYGMMEQNYEMLAVDPAYGPLFDVQLTRGRWLTEADGERLMNPTVVNEMLYKEMGEPSLASYPQLALSGPTGVRMTVVGVVADRSRWDSPRLHVPYESMAAAAMTQLSPMDSATVSVLVPRGEEGEAQKVLVSVLQGRLGKNYQVEGQFIESQMRGQESTERQVTAIIAAIGGIVILVGALGLLTVSIVTMKQRVREMGIRRAMGASARRIFTSVFLESVVATTAAGFIGVIASIVTIRTAPLARWLDLPFSVDSVGYPVLAAFIGLAISAGVGALCGIIPATMALRIKPIDAIRF